MSGSRSAQKSSAAGQAPRRAASQYDKMQDARARRAAVLEARDAANLPVATGKKTEPEPQAMADSGPEEPLAPPAEQATPESVAPPERRRPVWVIRVLFLLLIALIAVAVARYRPPEPETAPDVSSATDALSLPGLGTPSFIAVSREQPLPAPQPPRQALAAPFPDGSPTRPILPASAGPSVADEIDALSPPPARPADLVILTGAG